MILKSFEINKINLNNNKLILLYGKNEGLKNEIINSILKEKKKIILNKYEEKEILDNGDIFVENIISQSLFENEKIIIVKRVTEKIMKLLEKVNLENINDVIILFNSENLEKKSKLRLMFEKSKNFLCIPVYPDTDQSLIKLTHIFFKKKNISISPSNINLIVNKCNGDREVLLNELEKIECFGMNGKKFSEANITKLTNLIENHSVTELIDHYLTKNKKKIINILNENNFNNNDCILIIRTLLNKTKRILKLSIDFQNNKNIELTISSARPPIFWKDKEITKQQILKWTPDNIKKLIYRLSEIEFLIKNNINTSFNIVADFILDQTNS